MSDLENFIHYGWIPRLSSDIGLTSKNYSLFDAKVGIETSKYLYFDRVILPANLLSPSKTVLYKLGTDQEYPKWIEF